MGDEERDILKTLIKKLSEKQDSVDAKINIAVGAITMFGLIGVILGAITTAYMRKIDSTDTRSLVNEKEIAINKTRLSDYERWRQNVDIKLERKDWK